MSGPVTTPSPRPLLAWHAGDSVILATADGPRPITHASALLALAKIEAERDHKNYWSSLAHDLRIAMDACALWMKASAA